MPESEPSATSARFAVSDIHGHPEEFRSALQRKHLVDASGRWTGGTAQLCCLGDYFDRGTDGIAVIELLIRLQQEAADAGGSVTALLGNHEVLALGMHRFGRQSIATAHGPRSFEASWTRNQGQASDQARLTDQHLDWLQRLPAMAKSGSDILLHSDISGYQEWGRDPHQVNAQVGVRLRSASAETLWGLWSDLTRRRQFRGPAGSRTANGFLAHFDGDRIVHGHSVIGEADGRPAMQNTRAESYAGGRVLAIDAGLSAGGPCLIVEL
ncbi:MAG: metallophosphoesterase [Renibacterium sp.]|nr:metallophosphoesterase [Renibacterium sp.]